MFLLVIEFDRTRGGETRRERRFWTYADQREAEAETSHFAQLAHAGSTNFLRNGDKLTFQECRLYRADTDDRKLARQIAASGKAHLLRHAFNPALHNAGYWEKVLDRLDDGEPID